MQMKRDDKLCFAVLLFVLVRETQSADCTALDKTTYQVYDGDTHITLECPKHCPEGDDLLWNKRESNVIGTPVTRREYSNSLRLGLEIDRKPGGFYCCSCRNSPHSDPCCYGVAISPQVKQFSISDQDGNYLRGVHVGEPLQINCSVTGYPKPEVLISGPINVDKKPWSGNTVFNSYVMNRSLNVPYATESFTGNFSCVGVINVTQKEGPSTSLAHVQEIVVYAQPKITNLSASTENAKGDEMNFIIVCIVECSILYSVSWIFAKENIANLNTTGKYHSSSRDPENVLLVVNVTEDDLSDDYTCIVSTIYSQYEVVKSLSDTGVTYSEGLHGHHPNSSTNNTGSKLYLLSLLSFIIVAFAIMYYIGTKMQLLKVPSTWWHRYPGRKKWPGPVRYIKEENTVLLMDPEKGTEPQKQEPSMSEQQTLKRRPLHYANLKQTLGIPS